MVLDAAVARASLFSLSLLPLSLVQAELDNGAAVAALRRFNNNLAALPAENWGATA